jgi:hypothetical protein
MLPAAAQSPGGGASGFTATAIAPTSQEETSKSVSGQLAQSDPSLLGRTDATPVNVMVKLDFDASASYTGDVAGLAATSPKVTGQKLNGSSAPEQAYDAYTKSLIDQASNDIVANVPSAKIGRSLQTVYGGLSVQVPANEVGPPLAHSGAAVPRKLEATDRRQHSVHRCADDLESEGQTWGRASSSPTSTPASGRNIRRSPTTASAVHQRRATGGACNFGDNPLTPAVDLPVQPQGDRWPAVPGDLQRFIGGEVYLGPDSGGHGTHTTSTPRRHRPSTPIFGIERGLISGVAPGAWVIEYKVCGLEGCFSSDSAAAVQQAVKDGADVINF